MSDFRDNFDGGFGDGGGGGRGRWSEMPPSRRNAPTMEIGPDTVFDYKDSHALSAFITDRGKIIPRRVSGLTAKQQRQLTTAIKRARNIALLP